MNNPINPINRSPVNPISTNTGKTQAKESTESSNSNSNSNSNSASSQETVSLSSQSELKLHLSNASEVDSAKVEALKQEIAKGNYPLDPQKIAENLISLEQSLIE